VFAIILVLLDDDDDDALKVHVGEEGNDDNGIEELGVKQCIRVTLEQGQTFIIPTGWIHAVHTPVDSIVFGGNFLHGLDMEGQLKIHCLETRTRVPAKFRFPSFVQLMYYAGTLYFQRLKRLNTFIVMNNNNRDNDNKNVVQKVNVQAVQRNDTTALVEVSTLELEGLKTLVSALKTWAVNPGGDASRFGSVAHVGLKCVASVADHGVRSMDDLLNGLMAEIVTQEQMLRDGIDIKLMLLRQKKPTPAPRLKLSIKRKVSSDSSPPMKSPVTPISLMVEGMSKKDHISGQPEVKASSSPSPPKLKLKLGKAATVPSLSSNSNSQQIEGYTVKAENAMESDEDVEDDDIIPAFTFSSSTGERDVNPTQPLSSMQPISNNLKTLSNVGPGNNRVSNRNKDLASRHNAMDDEWLPDEDVTSAIMDKKLLLQQSSKKKNTTRTSTGDKGKAVSSQRKKPKVSGGGSRSRLMKKLKF